MIKLQESCKNMRKNIIELGYKAGSNGAHFGSALSIVEIMRVLYHIMKFDKNNLLLEDRDRFILSKGHGSLAYYTVLFEADIITKEQLFTFEDNGGDFPGQPSMNQSLGIEYASGSLGLGLSLGIGNALASRLKNVNYNVYVLLGDGEINEGSVWEAVMLASHLRLNNLVAIIDQNNMQSDGSTCNVLETDLESMFSGFGWNVQKADGHDIDDLLSKFSNLHYNKPTVVIADTVKGKGISFMENNNDWHHNVLTKTNYDKAIEELC